VYIKCRNLVTSAIALCSSRYFSKLKKKLQQIVWQNLLVMGCYVLQCLVFITFSNNPVCRIVYTVDYGMRNFRANCLFGFPALQIEDVRSSCTFVSVTGRLPCIFPQQIQWSSLNSLPWTTSRCFRFMYADNLNCNHKLRFVTSEHPLSFLH
jgi:hypothetical protein